jgi:hypothetical protein
LAARLIPIFRFNNLEEAFRWQEKLESAGIESEIIDESRNFPYPWAIELYTGRQDKKKALKILKEAPQPPVAHYKVWETWMVAMGLGWFLVAVGGCLWAFVESCQIIWVLIFAVGVVLVVLGFYGLRQSNLKK